MKSMIMIGSFIILVCSCSNVKSKKNTMVANPSVVVEMPIHNNQDIEMTHVLARPGQIVILIKITQTSDERAYQIVQKHTSLEIPRHDHQYRQVVFYGAVDCMTRPAGTCFVTWQEAKEYYQQEGYTLLASKQ